MVESISKTYEDTKFASSILRVVRQSIEASLSKNGNLELYDASVKERNTRFRFKNEIDDEAEFYEKYSKEVDVADLTWRNFENGVSFYFHYMKFSAHSETTINVKLPTLSAMQSVLSILDDSQFEAREGFPQLETKSPTPTIFLGHGRSQAWRDLRDHLSDHHGYKVEAYESGARAGHAIRDIVEDMAKNSDIAFLVHTAEDEMKDGTFQTRPNVIHETGLFQGKLGYSRAIVLLEEGCEEFSNLAGIQQIRFSKGNIRETFGDVLATLKREFDDK
ncbi:MAG: nucleotide-binding protein [Sediminimonas sp.]|uniref:nucleotide-binding protein n=1 Tax=Sediminimonas sp. TaxID=2823379 RepID=UPI00286FD3AF|nr:nucleotide-binding protein [Sediminimonas sp.]MDR9486054.1 nucleotide-binding protein [Sediminimonas sp.]